MSELIAKFINRLVGLLFIATSLFVTSCGLGEKLFSTITPDEAEEVKTICSSVKLPSSFVKVQERDTVKENLASRITQYSSTESTDEIEKFFIEQLTAKGWKYKRDRLGISISLLFK